MAWKFALAQKILDAISPRLRTQGNWASEKENGEEKFVVYCDLGAIKLLQTSVLT